jgi:DNA invertase Pin-like site-specific DNA recombinase
MRQERVGIYARVSTLDKGQDVELQLSELRTYAAARGWGIFKEYVDIGQSGSKEQRPSFIQLMEDSRRRKIDIILVWRLDRFGRSLKQLVVSLDELKTLGVGFVSLKESLDFTTSTGRLMLHLLGAFAEFEKDLIRERVIAGVAHARSKGKRLGRPNGNVDLEKLLVLRQRGFSIRKISKEMNMSIGLVHKSLRNYAPQGIDNSRTEYQGMSVH